MILSSKAVKRLECFGIKTGKRAAAIGRDREWHGPLVGHDRFRAGAIVMIGWRVGRGRCLCQVMLQLSAQRPLQHRILRPLPPRRRLQRCPAGHRDRAPHRAPEPTADEAETVSRDGPWRLPMLRASTRESGQPPGEVVNCYARLYKSTLRPHQVVLEAVGFLEPPASAGCSLVWRAVQLYW